jgi:dolichol kinase
MLRKHEMKKKKLLLTGASWVLISAVLTVLIFPKVIAVIAFIILIISDISAALVGRKWGRTKLGKKSLEGTLAFIVSGLLVVAVVGNTI